MHPMPQSNAVDLKYPKSFLLGTSALVCLALAAPVMADDFTIASGSQHNDGNTIDGGDTVTCNWSFDNHGSQRRYRNHWWDKYCNRVKDWQHYDWYRSIRIRH